MREGESNPHALFGTEIPIKVSALSDTSEPVCDRSRAPPSRLPLPAGGTPMIFVPGVVISPVDPFGWHRHP